MSQNLDRHRGGPDRVPLIRHLALCAAVPVGFLVRENQSAGLAVLWIVGAAAVLNLATSLRPHGPRPGRALSILSSAIGLMGWTALSALTGGLASPFIAGLWLEIVLSISGTSAAGTVLTTLGAVAGLGAQPILTGVQGHATRLLLLTGFLLLAGGLTVHIAGRWRRSQRRMARRILRLRRRLVRIETRLDEERALGGQSESVARLAHGLKNTVHSMRGFVGLLEPQMGTSTRCQPLLDGLRSAIDHLEETARATLGRPGPREARAAREAEVLTPEAVRDTVRQVAVSFPEVTWSLALDAMPAGGGAPAPLMRDALVGLLRNAAEAMHGGGEVRVEAIPQDGRLEIRIQDRGPGLRPDLAARLFEPGRTTKESGHGLGLFLARRLLEASGGRLTLSPADGGGVLCSMELPTRGPAARET